jgi:hypothetical protein
VICHPYHLRTALNPALLLIAIVLAVASLVTETTSAATSVDKIQSLGGGRFLAAETRSLSARGLQGLRLSGPANLSGHVVVAVGREDSILVGISKVLRVESEEIAADLDQEIQVELHPSENAVRIDVRTPTGAPWEGTDWGVTLDLTITIPANWDLSFDTRHFEYDLTGPFRDVDISTEFGRVKVSKVTRHVEIRGSYTGIELAEIKGAIIAKTTYADIDVQEAISDVDRPAQLANTSGSITVKGLAGALVAETHYAPIRLERISLVGSTSRVVGDNSQIDMDIVEFGRARLEVETSYAPIRVYVPSHLSARLNVAVGSTGTIRTSGLVIQTHPDLLGARRLEGICGAGDGIIDIRSSGPALVEIHGR